MQTPNFASMEILIIFLLILLNGVFAMSEIAMVSSRKSRLELSAKKGDKLAIKALEFANNPGKFLSTVQIGITLIGILTGIYSGEKIEDDLITFLNTFELTRNFSASLAVIIIVTTLTFLSMLLGELVPKRIGMTKPERIAKTLAYPLFWLSRITAPFIWLLTKSSDLLIFILRIKPSLDSKVTEEEIKAIIKEGTEGGAIDEIEQDIVERVFNLSDRDIASLMTHRNDTIVLKLDYNAEKVMETVNNEMHSIYPVVDSKMNVIGVITLKDLFKNINKEDFKLSDLLLQAQFTSENTSVYDALKMFKSTNINYSIVVDEFGLMQGIATINDLLSSLVGDVSDLNYTDFTFVKRNENSWLIDGQFPFYEFLRKFELEEFFNDYEFNTLGGLAIHTLKKVPKTGDTFNWQNFSFEIVDMDGARIDKMMVTLKK